MKRYVKPSYKRIMLKDKTIIDISDYVIDREEDVFVNLKTGDKIKLVDAIKGGDIMTKKIEELTIRDVKNICLKHKNCVNCPLEKYGFLCLGLRNMKEKTLKEEVEF